MIPKTLGLSSRGRPVPPGWRLVVQSWVWLTLVGILVLSAFLPAGARADRKMTFHKKGPATMKPALSALKQDLPPLDAVPSVRFETFTFGLG
jgi:hypothetical protein